MLRFRNGLSRATNRERLALLNVERYCISQALQAYYWDRLTTYRVVIFDLEDVKPVRTRIRWTRSKGKLLVMLDVYIGASGVHHAYKLRCDVATHAHRELEGYAKRCRQTS